MWQTEHPIFMEMPKCFEVAVTIPCRLLYQTPRIELVFLCLTPSNMLCWTWYTKTRSVKGMNITQSSTLKWEVNTRLSNKHSNEATFMTLISKSELQKDTEVIAYYRVAVTFEKVVNCIGAKSKAPFASGEHDAVYTKQSSHRPAPKQVLLSTLMKRVH